MAKRYDNGIYREETPEELAERQRLIRASHTPESSNSAQIMALQQQMKDLELAYRKGVNA